MQTPRRTWSHIQVTVVDFKVSFTFIGKAESRKEERHKKIFYLLFTLQTAMDGQKLNQSKARSFLWLLHMGAGSQGLVPASFASSKKLDPKWSSWDSNRSHRWRLSLLCHIILLLCLKMVSPRKATSMFPPCHPFWVLTLNWIGSMCGLASSKG